MGKYVALSIIILISAFALGCFSSNDGRTLAIVGIGSVKAKPDTATLRLGVEVSMPTAAEAQNKSANIIQKVTSEIKKLQIADENIMTSGYNIWPEMKYPPNQAPKITGYHCSNQVQITLEDLKNVSKVLDTSIAAGANSVQGIAFSIKNDEQLKKEALEKAMKDASSKALAISKASNMNLSGIKKIIESSSVTDSPYQPMYAMGIGGTGGADSSVSTGLIEIKANITVIYGLK